MITCDRCGERIPVGGSPTFLAEVGGETQQFDICRRCEDGAKSAADKAKREVAEAVRAAYEAWWPEAKRKAVR